MVKRFKCFNSDINVGLKYSRADVLGVRDIGGRLSGEVETIIIEVKMGAEPFATASGQAVGYSVYANRVYLAHCRPGGFTQSEIQIASRLGVGLVLVKGKRCSEVLSSPHHQPITRMHLEILEKLALGQCRICGTFFQTGGDKSKPHAYLSRSDIRRATKYKTGVLFWNHELAERKWKLNIEGSHPKKGWSYERRFICDGCVADLWGPFLIESAGKSE